MLCCKNTDEKKWNKYTRVNYADMEHLCANNNTLQIHWKMLHIELKKSHVNKKNMNTELNH